MIDAYTIKSYTRQAYRNNGDASGIMETVFDWALMDLDKSKSSPIKLESVIVAIKRKCSPSIRCEFDPSTLQYHIHIRSLTCILQKESTGCVIFMGSPHRRKFHLTYQSQEDIADLMTAFQDYIYIIEEELLSCKQEEQKKRILCDMSEATARGMISELERTGEVRMPDAYRVIGKSSGRVSIYDSENLRFSCPLTHLRAMLKLKFPNR